MIRFFLLQNRAGKTRLAKYYTPLSDDDKKRTEDEVHRLIVNRDAKFTNFLEVGAAGCGGEGAGSGCRRLLGERGTMCAPALAAAAAGAATLLTHSALLRPSCSATQQYKTFKVVYRRYAGLYFIFCVDVSDNELLYLETIHLFVEVRAGGQGGQLQELLRSARQPAPAAARRGRASAAAALPAQPPASSRGG